MIQNGLNALHLASKEGHVEVVTELIKLGATVDASTKVRRAHGIKALLKYMYMNKNITRVTSAPTKPQSH